MENVSWYSRRHTTSLAVKALVPRDTHASDARDGRSRYDRMWKRMASGRSGQGKNTSRRWAASSEDAARTRRVEPLPNRGARRLSHDCPRLSCCGRGPRGMSAPWLRALRRESCTPWCSTGTPGCTTEELAARRMTIDVGENGTSVATLHRSYTVRHRVGGACHDTKPECTPRHARWLGKERTGKRVPRVNVARREVTRASNAEGATRARESNLE